MNKDINDKKEIMEIYEKHGVKFTKAGTLLKSAANVEFLITCMNRCSELGIKKSIGKERTKEYEELKLIIKSNSKYIKDIINSLAESKLPKGGVTEDKIRELINSRDNLVKVLRDNGNTVDASGNLF